MHNYVRLTPIRNQVPKPEGSPTVSATLSFSLKTTSTCTFQETKFSLEGEFLDAVKEHFPLLVEDAKKALTNWTPNTYMVIGMYIVQGKLHVCMAIYRSINYYSNYLYLWYAN